MLYTLDYHRVLCTSKYCTSKYCTSKYTLYILAYIILSHKIIFNIHSQFDLKNVVIPSNLVVKCTLAVRCITQGYTEANILDGTLHVKHALHLNCVTSIKINQKKHM